MTKLAVLLSLLLSQAIDIPLHTIRYGKISVPLCLSYEPSSSGTGFPVANDWVLRNGTPSAVVPLGAYANGEGTHYYYGNAGELVRVVDDAGNAMQLDYEGGLPVRMSWRRGVVDFDNSGGCIKGIALTDADGYGICRANFETDGQTLTRVVVLGPESSSLKEYDFTYAASGLLRSISLKNGGKVEYVFADDSGKTLKSVVRLDAEGELTGASSYAYSQDSLFRYITETVSDSCGVSRVVESAYLDDMILIRKEWSGSGALKRSSWFRHCDVAGQKLPSRVTIIDYPDDSLAPPSMFMQSVRYASDSRYHYPVEVEIEDNFGHSEKIAYTYPFCPAEGYGPVADSLLKRDMSGLVLSVTRWKDGERQDSSAVVYSDFPGTLAPSGRIFRPYAIMYAGSSHAKADTVEVFTAWDTLGLFSSRSKVLSERLAAQIPTELTRRLSPSPLADLQSEEHAHSWCAGRTDIYPDAVGGKNFLFDGGGKFLGKVVTGDEDCKIIADAGPGASPIVARFADPDTDPPLVTRHYDVEIVPVPRIKQAISKGGAFSNPKKCFFKGMVYLYKESQFGRLLDFASNPAYDLYPRVLYINTEGKYGPIAHDNHNFGNFLWGASARELGVPAWIARLGAHFNNFFLSEFTRGSFDSPDDQFSIQSGYYWDGRE